MPENIDAAEIAKFEALASRWWDPESEFKPLHDMNPVRMRYIDSWVNVAGLKVLDVGCGGGILAETLAKRGAEVVGIDMTDMPLKVAQLHAREQQLDNLSYYRSTAEQLATQSAGEFDVVTCMEMLEHVPDPAAVVKAVSVLLKPGGRAFFSTINRNPKSFLFAIVGAEYILKLLPKGTHEFRKLIKPAELASAARVAQLEVVDCSGMLYNPLSRNFKIGKDVSVNYIMTTTKQAAA